MILVDHAIIFINSKDFLIKLKKQVDEKKRERSVVSHKKCRLSVNTTFPPHIRNNFSLKDSCLILQSLS